MAGPVGPALRPVPRWYLVLGLAALAGPISYLLLPVDPLPRAALFLAAQLFTGAASVAALLWRRDEAEPPPWGWVLLFAVLCRAAAIPSDLIFENDVFRYLWDARVAASGVNPFAHAPASEALAHLRDDWVWEQIPYREVPTIYPPIAQGVFLTARALFGETVEGLQLVMVAFDLGTLALLFPLGNRLGTPRAAAAYALHPLAIKEFANGAHVDAAAIFLFTLAAYLILSRRDALAAVAVGAAALVKVYPLVAVPVLWRRFGIAKTALLLAVFGGALGAVWLAGSSPLAGLRVFATYWIFNPSLYDLVARGLGLFSPPEVAHTFARPLCGAAVLAIALWLAARVAPQDDRGLLRAALLAIFALLLLSPAANPWYVAWLLPLALVTREPGVLAWTYTASLSYAYWAGEQDVPLIRALQYAAPLAVWLYTARWSTRSTGAPPQGGGRQ